MTSSEQQPRAPKADGERPQDAKQHPPTNSTEALDLRALENVATARLHLGMGEAGFTQSIRDFSEAFDPPGVLRLLSHLRELQEENARLREGLKPFAEACRDADEEWVEGAAHAWESAMSMAVTFEDFRRAKQALTTPRTETDQ